MRITCNRDALLAAFGAVAGLVPTRSPKPVLQNVLLCVNDGATLSATDMEVWITRAIGGVSAEDPAAVLLPAARFGQIIRSVRDDEIGIEAGGDSLVITAGRSRFKLAADDPSLFPADQERSRPPQVTVLADDLRRLIHRTAFATDIESARYALGGVLVETEGERLGVIGTDGRRLARALADARIEDAESIGKPVVPVKALKLIDRNLDVGGLVGLAFDAQSVTVTTDAATIRSRLVEGRFPRYQDVFPTSVEAAVSFQVGTLRAAVEQAAILTSEESRGVDFHFAPGALTLSGKAADVGESKVETPIEYNGEPIDVTLDARYLLDALKAMDDGEHARVELIDGKNAVVMRAGDDYSYVVMPLTRER